MTFRVPHSDSRDGERVRNKMRTHAAFGGGGPCAGPRFFLQHAESGAGAVSAVGYSGDFKTDEINKVSTIFRIFSAAGKWRHFWPKLRNKPSLGKSLGRRIFRTFGMCFTNLHALVWTVHVELVHVRDCIKSCFQSAWFGKKKFCCNPRAGQTAAGQRSAKNDCCCSNIGMTVL